MAVDVLTFSGKSKPVVSHRQASSTAGRLMSVLTLPEFQANDLIATLRFDCAPADIDALETFIGNLFTRIRDHGNRNGNNQSIV